MTWTAEDALRARELIWAATSRISRPLLGTLGLLEKAMAEIERLGLEVERLGHEMDELIMTPGTRFGPDPDDERWKKRRGRHGT